MKLFLDTNVLVPAVTRDINRSDRALDTQRGRRGVRLRAELDGTPERADEKKQFERHRIDQIENRITSRTTVTFPDASDVVSANRLQSETLLYPMGALVLAAANAVDAALVTFDGELVDHGAELPADVL